MANKKSEVYYGEVISLCETCLTLVPARVLFRGGEVFYDKLCPEHGFHSSLVSTDINYYRRTRERITLSYTPDKFITPVAKGCPWDCGLCDQHEQHTCMGIVEVTDDCNMRCPTCIAGSFPGASNTRTVEEIDQMLNLLVEAEGTPDIVMISGGEPTIHPDILYILHLAKSKPIHHLMLITNGVRIANDLDFVRDLQQLGGGFEVYLQFDSLNPEVLTHIRGENLTDVRLRAIQNLEAAGIPMTLICVVKKGVNDHEVAETVRFALQHPLVRGVTFQPIKNVGRTELFDKGHHTITLSEVRQKLIQSGVLPEEDLVPHPCSPENISIGYLLRTDDGVLPVTRHLYGTRSSPHSATFNDFPFSAELSSMMYFLPLIDTPNFNYNNLFRVTIVSFLDQYDFAVHSVKRSCIHFITRQHTIVPLDVYYLLYDRSGVESDCSP